jgi:hypothetical protein
MTTHWIRADVKNENNVTSYQVVPDIDKPTQTWMGTKEEATSTVEYLKRRAPSTDTFVPINGTPGNANPYYDMKRLVERTPDDVKETSNG